MSNERYQIKITASGDDGPGKLHFLEAVDKMVDLLLATADLDGVEVKEFYLMKATDCAPSEKEN